MPSSRPVPVLLAVMRHIVGLLVICIFFVPSSRAQQDYLLQLGTPPGQPTMAIPMGVVNLKNGNVHLEIPLRTLVQRNGLKVTSKLIYDSSNCFYMYGGTNCISGWREVYSPFQPSDTPFPPYIETSQNTIQCPQGGPNAGLWYTQRTWSNFAFTEATGTSHLMNVQVDNSWVACSGQADGSSGYAFDGSGYFMDVTLSSPNGPPTWTVRDRSGNLMGAGKDTNGNILSSSDELGRSYMPGPIPPNGVGSQQFAGATMQWESIPIHSNFGNNYYPDLSLSISTISSITLPDGRSYQFIYDQGTTPGNYGQIIEMTLPTGGQVSFTYANISPTNMDGPDRRLTSLSLGGATWNFAYQITYNPQSPPSSPSATTVTAPADAAGIQNQTLYSFTAACLGPNATTPWSAKYYAGAATGTPLRENDVVLDCTGALVLQETTILENGMSSKVVWNYQSNNINLPGSSNVTSKQEYDFSGSLARETTATYQTSATYTNLQITDRPLTVKVYGAGGAASGPLLAQTNYTYDSTSLSTTSGSAGNSVLGATGHDDANYGASNTIRGNLTSVSQMVSPGNFITTKTNYYNILGQLTRTIDGRGNSISYDYTDNWASGTSSCVSGPTFAYPTTATYPATVTDKSVTTYNACDGTVYSVQDQNDLNAGRAGTINTYDSLQRLTNVAYPDGGSKQSNYGGTAIPQIVTTTTAITSSLSMISSSTLDGLGRTVQTQLTSDPDNPTYTATTYDNLGRPYQSYNPTRCSPQTTNCGETTWGYTTTAYDALSRVTSITKQDGSVVSTSYSGNCTTATDEAGKARKSCSDALGRLTQVFEDPSGLNYETDYTYDALDNLLTVTQKGGTTNSALWRPRTFRYDSLSRLTSATNPESGTVTYSYDANGNLMTKISPAPNQTGSPTVSASYIYDPLNRLTQKSFSDGTTPTVKYGYDAVALSGCAVAPPSLTDANPIGSRTAMCDGAGSESWNHDSMGRVLTDARTTSGVTKTIPYTYNLDGSLYSLTYRQDTYPMAINYTPGGAGRPISAGNSSFGLAYNVHYAPNGSLCSVYSAWGQAFEHNYTFNNRFQVIDIQDWDQTWYAYDHGSSPPPCTAIADGHEEQLHLTYSYTDPSGHNNGNVQRINNNLDMERTQLFTYDSLNRLATAETLHQNQPWWQGDSPTAECWGEQFNYDPWGNLTGASPVSSAYTGCTQENWSMTPTTKNQLQDTNADYVYDAAGNLIQPGPIGGPYVFDAENHLISAGGMAYLYDGDGKRVGKAPASTPTQPNYLYWYGTGSQILEETDGAGNYAYEDYYFNGMLLARGESDNWVDHFFADALGNTRCVYGDGDPDGGCSDYYPFGGERPIPSCCPTNPGGVNVPFMFTGKERDPESGLDNFGARYNSSNFGRFMSPDPSNVGAAATDPQSWNGYAYVRNNPLNLTDPDGRSFFVCVKNDQGTQNCTIYDNDMDFYRDAAASGATLSGGNINVNGTQIGTYQHFGPGGDDTQGTLPDNIIAPAVELGALRNIVGGVQAFFEGLLGTGARGTISGLYGSVTRDALEAAANSGGPTVRLVTNLTQAPAAGQGLSTAVGEGAETLANAAREAGTTYVANVPKALLDQLENAGLAFRSTTTMGGATAQEIRFAPQAAEFIAKSFRAVPK